MRSESGEGFAPRIRRGQREIGGQEATGSLGSRQACSRKESLGRSSWTGSMNRGRQDAFAVVWYWRHG
jgi:hypothetical protein